MEVRRERAQVFPGGNSLNQEYLLCMSSYLELVCTHPLSILYDPLRLHAKNNLRPREVKRTIGRTVMRTCNVDVYLPTPMTSGAWVSLVSYL